MNNRKSAAQHPRIGAESEIPFFDPEDWGYYRLVPDKPAKYRNSAPIVGLDRDEIERWEYQRPAVEGMHAAVRQMLMTISPQTSPRSKRIGR